MTNVAILCPGYWMLQIFKKLHQCIINTSTHLIQPFSLVTAAVVNQGTVVVFSGSCNMWLMHRQVVKGLQQERSRWQTPHRPHVHVCQISTQHKMAKSQSPWAAAREPCGICEVRIVWYVKAMFQSVQESTSVLQSVVCDLPLCVS